MAEEFGADSYDRFDPEVNSLWRADALWDNLVYSSRMGFLELHMGEMNLPLMVRLGSMKMPESIEKLSKAIAESPKSTARLLANYAEHNGWITGDMRNNIVAGAGFSAEEAEGKVRTMSGRDVMKRMRRTPQQIKEKMRNNPPCEECGRLTTEESRSGVEGTYEYVCSNDSCEWSSFPPHTDYGARRVRTMSGKPHSPRKLVKDKNITPKEAAKRMKLEADEGTFYNDGRIAAGIVFMPEMKDRESFGLMDAEYAFTFGLSPDELIAEMENGSKRYNQFSWGWGQEWDKLTSEYMLNPDEYSNESYQDDDFYNQSAEEFAGEWVGVAPFQEYYPDEKEILSWLGVCTLACATLIGYEAYRNKFAQDAESFGASEVCSEDDDCPDGKVCVDGKCLPICKDDGDCASWQECRDDLHPTEKVCGEDKSDSDENPFADILKRRNDDVNDPNDAPSNTKETYSTTTKALFGVGIVGAIGIGIKVLGGMQDKEMEE